MLHKTFKWHNVVGLVQQCNRLANGHTKTIIMLLVVLNCTGCVAGYTVLICNVLYVVNTHQTPIKHVRANVYFRENVLPCCTQSTQNKGRVQAAQADHQLQLLGRSEITYKLCSVRVQEN